MVEPVRYYSTNRSAPVASLDDALMMGQAPDRGLYMPERIPPLVWEEVIQWPSWSYARIAHAVLSPFTSGVFDDAVLRSLCEEAYDYDVPLERVTDRRYLMRLDRGPTASFKDFAARMMARWMDVLLRKRGGRLLILTATSGDTGSAVAHAYHGIDNIRVVVLFPSDEVSDRQRRQMTTIGGNVTAVSVSGKFDDCQAMVKQAFADPALTGLNLTSANSINIGRLLPQSVYYVYAYVKLADVAGREPIIVSVPSGNFGDMMGALIALKMGIPIARTIAATNANDEVPMFLRSGTYEKVVPSRACVSNAMNVGHPSNLARLVDLYGGWMDETGVVRRPPDFARLRRDIYTVSITDEETRATIKRAYGRHGAILEPHGAVGWVGLEQYLRDHPQHDRFLAVSVETAHPAKFPEEIRAALGIEPSVPPSLRGVEHRAEVIKAIPADYTAFCGFLMESFSHL